MQKEPESSRVCYVATAADFYDIIERSKQDWVVSGHEERTVCRELCF